MLQSKPWQNKGIHYHTKQSRRLTSTELVVGAVTVEVVTLAVLATVDLGRVVSFLALTGATDTVSIVTADICAVVFAAVGIQILRSHLIFTALAQPTNTPLIAPERTMTNRHKLNIRA